MELRETTTTLRRDYEPLSVTAYIAVSGSRSALAQIYDAASGEYAPNWEVNALALDIVVKATTNDGTLDRELSARDLNAEHLGWTINGKTLKELDDSFKGKVILNNTATDDTRGRILISRNMPVGETMEIGFKGILHDIRTGADVRIAPAPVVISSTAKNTDNQYTLAMIDFDFYNPFADKRSEKEICAAMGWVSQYPNVPSEAEGYLRTYPVTLSCANKPVTDFTIALTKKGDNTNMDEVVVDQAKKTLTIDLRLVGSAEYTVSAMVKGKAVATGVLSIMRKTPAYKVTIERNAPVKSDARWVRNSARVETNGTVIDHPEVAIRMVWRSTVGDNVMYWQEGNHCTIDTDKAGMADRMDIAVLTAPRDAMSILMDNGVVLTDKDGNILIG